jgi:hypothetical protein
MQQFIYLLLFFCIALLTSSCKLAYYPNKQITPLLEKKNDIQIDLGMSDLQLGYAITDHLGISANGHYLRYTRPDSSWGDIESERFRIEGGLGYFNAYSKHSSAGIYLGGGIGNVIYKGRSRINFFGSVNRTDYQFSALTSFIYLQPYWFHKFKSFNIHLSTRLIRMEFENVRFTDEVSTRIQNMGQQASLFIEPAFTHSFGNGPVRGFQQVLVPIALTKLPPNHAKFTYTFGIQFIFGSKKR